MRYESESDFLLLCKSKRMVGLIMHQDGISEKRVFLDIFSVNISRF